MSDLPTEADGYGAMITAARDFLDSLAAANPPQAFIMSLTNDLRKWTHVLADRAVAENEQIFGRRFDLPHRGQSMTPAFDVTHTDDHSIAGKVVFGRYFLGGNGAAHGGTIALLFDDILGRLAVSSNRSKSRTAYLNTDFRSITPIDVPLDFRVWFVREEGRKRLVRGEIYNGQKLCAEAEGLFLALKPGQP